MTGVITLLDQPRTLDALGRPTSAVISFYLTGTTTFANIYEDFALTTPAANPVTISSGEIFPDIYLDPAITYRRRIVYGDGSIHDVDPLPTLNVDSTQVTDELSAGTNTAEYSIHDYIEAGTLSPVQFDGVTEQEQLVNAIVEGNQTRDGSLGQTVVVPRGEISLNAPINIANRVTLAGVNKRGSRLIADPAHSGPYMATVVNGTSSMFDNPIKQLTLDCNSVAGLGGVISDAWQEGGGLRKALITEFTTYGAYFQSGFGGASSCVIETSELFGSPSGALAGVYVKEISAVGGFKLTVRDSTITGGGALPASLPYGIYFENDSSFISNTHFEVCQTGIYLDGVGDHTIICCDGAGGGSLVDTLVEIASTFTGTLTMLGCKRNGATNFIKDNRVGGVGTIQYDMQEFRIYSEIPSYSGGLIAWGNFDGTTVGSPSIANCKGLSSITRVGPGNWTLTLSRSLPAATDLIPLQPSANINGVEPFKVSILGANSFRLELRTPGGTPIDANEIKFAVIRR